jgi:predicted flap endonuclease-1-like 5' DNA nuclease
MKNTRTILVFVVLLIACVAALVYPFAAGMALDTPVLVMVALLIVGIVIAIGGIALAAGLSQQKKMPEPQVTAVEAPKVEPLKPVEENLTETASSIPSPVPAPVKKASEQESKIIDIEGIGPVYASKLNANNIYTTSDLLEAGATPLGRKELAEKTGVSGSLILRWVNMADLFRIKGVGEEYSDLLEAAGVDTVVELSKRVPENLHAKMVEVNAEKNLVRRQPSLSEVTRWVGEAKTLQRKIEY